MNKLKIQTRDLKLSPKAMRKNGFIPGSIYGKTIESTPIGVRANDLRKALSHTGEVYQVEFENKKYFTKVYEVQKDPISGAYISFSLVELPKGETSDLELPVVLTGSSLGEKAGGTIVLLKDHLKVNGLVKDMPEELFADISQMNIGDKLTVSDLSIGRKLTIVDDEDEAIIVCKAPLVVVIDEVDNIEHETEVINQEDNIDPAHAS